MHMHTNEVRKNITESERELILTEIHKKNRAYKDYMFYTTQYN